LRRFPPLGRRFEDLAPIRNSWWAGCTRHYGRLLPAGDGRFRVVACAATTKLMSDGLVAAMTLVVGSCSGMSDGSSCWSPRVVKSELRLRGPAATMTCVGRSGDDLHRRESCISPLRSSSSESKLSALLREEATVWHGPMWASRGCCGEVFLGDRSWMKSESLARGGVMTTTSVGCIDDDLLSWRCVCSLCW